MGPFAGYEDNKEHMLRVLRQHQEAAAQIDEELVPSSLLSAAQQAWDEANELAQTAGVRNSQASVLAPTGTIGLMMDCDTTGIEPDLALVKFKKLVGGGSMQIVNQTVPRALRSLGYQEEQVEAIVEHIAQHGNVVDAPGLKLEHYEVFDCAMGERSISAMGHVRLMAAIQPFVSGALSKTVNLPAEATVEDVADVYFQGWKMGLKALAIYRNNSKVGQPLQSKKDSEKGSAVDEEVGVARPTRRRLPKRRNSKTISFSVAGAEGYMTAGEYEDGTVGEVFIKMSKQGSTLAGVMDAFSISISIGLQYGVPLEAFVSKYINMRFDPAGLTDDADVRMAQSIMDYIFRRLALDYLSFEDRAALGIYSADERQRYLETGSYELPTEVGNAAEVIGDLSAPDAPEAVAEAELVETAAEHEATDDLAPKPAPQEAHTSAELLEKITGTAVDSPLCMTCGTKMRPAGSCYVCEGCGSTSGCS
jgi:ribonucleoside-diphosphate reductase alpha chain